MSPLFYAVGASGRKNLRRGVIDFALQNYGKNFIYANLFAKKCYTPHGLHPHLSKSGRANIQRIETDEHNRPHVESGQRG